jgi:hypothetical protein
MEMLCPQCARTPAAAEARVLSWSSLLGLDGSVSWICPECTRNGLPEIEALLPLFPGG